MGVKEKGNSVSRTCAGGLEPENPIMEIERGNLEESHLISRKNIYILFKY